MTLSKCRVRDPNRLIPKNILSKMLSEKKGWVECDTI